MTICLKCGKTFHACSSCGLSYNYEYRYCREKCWKESDEYQKTKDIFLEFYNSLSQKQKESFETVQECFCNDFEYEIDNWTK